MFFALSGRIIAVTPSGGLGMIWETPSILLSKSKGMAPVTAPNDYNVSDEQTVWLFDSNDG